MKRTIALLALAFSFAAFAGEPAKAEEAKPAAAKTEEAPAPVKAAAKSGKAKKPAKPAPKAETK